MSYYGHACGAYSDANLLCGLCQMRVVLGSLGIDMELGASCVADCVPVVVLAVACSLIFCCLRATISKRQMWAIAQNLSRVVVM